MKTDPQRHSRLLHALEGFGLAHPLDRKVLVAPTFGEGRELLHSLARASRGWVGFDHTTPGRLAAELAAPEIASRGLELLDDFGRQATVDQAADEILAGGGWQHLGELSEGLGFREALHDAVDALRLAPVTPGALQGAELRDRLKQRFLATLLARYEALLEEDGSTDTAAVLALAIDLLEGGADFLRGVPVALLPGLTARGLSGRFVQALRERGAELLATDPVVGEDPPGGQLWAVAEPALATSYLSQPVSLPADMDSVEIELFSAASVSDELREVLRRIMERGIPWDQVEIVATDAASYGSALHALSQRLDIPVSYAVGIPVGRTRVGRAVAAFLRWIEDGFPADTIRVLLHGGDLRPPTKHDAVTPGAMARRLRALGIGWHRERYGSCIRSALEHLETAEPRREEEAEEAERRVARARREVRALEATLMPVLRALPEISSGAGEPPSVQPGRLARALRIFLERVPRGRGAEAVAAERVRDILLRVEETLRRPTAFPSAVAVLREHLRIAVPASRQGQPAPWEATGGHLHLTDVRHGGASGRAVTFVVGMGAEGGDPLQDPLLLDAERRTLAPRDLPSTADRGAEAHYRLASLMAKVRGALVLSYTAWDPSQGRVLAPHPLLLQAFRLSSSRPDATFSDLRSALGAPASAVPGASCPLDAFDVWMGALEGDDGLLDGEALVRAGFPDLSRGLAATDARARGEATVHDGIIEPRKGRLDPRLNPDVVLSASRLEDLGACPKRYFYRQVLKLRPPDDPEREPDRWLDPLHRGSLLHAVFEGALRRAREEGVDAGSEAFADLAREVLAEETRRMRREVPPPGEGVLVREVRRLEEDVAAFHQLLKEKPAPWEALELPFGWDGADPAVVELPGGPIHLRGRVDRVDRLDTGLRVVDYKTGQARHFGGDTGVFHGGRRLQHVVYTAVVEGLLDAPVVVAEYHFPTPRGQNQIYDYTRSQMEPGLELLDALLEIVARGRFLPTEDPEDCGFCDFQSLCRVTRDRWGRVHSPPADWAEEHRLSVPEYEELRRVRGWEDQ